jgi:hypothetical protein
MIRQGLCGQPHDFRLIDPRGASAARQVTLDARQAFLCVASPPASDLDTPHAQLLGDPGVVVARGRHQHNACPPRQTYTRRVRARQLRQLFFLFHRQLNFPGNSHRFPPVSESRQETEDADISSIVYGAVH